MNNKNIKPVKVIYNNCYGGFMLSEEAIDEIKKRKKLKLDEEVYELPRHDKDLVSVVEELGDKANGLTSNLEIDFVYSSINKIEDFDGLETVVELDDENIYFIEKN